MWSAQKPVCKTATKISAEDFQTLPLARFANMALKTLYLIKRRILMGQYVF
jgi:hypothetical protein